MVPVYVTSHVRETGPTSTGDELWLMPQISEVPWDIRRPRGGHRVMVRVGVRV